MLLGVILSAALVLTAVLWGLYRAWRLTQKEADDERAQIMVEFVTLAVQSIAAVAIIAPVIPTVLDFQRQWEDSNATQREHTEQENNAQFALAIETLRSTEMPSTEGAIVMLDLLRKRDRGRFETPVRRVLRGTLIDLQDDYPEQVIDLEASDRTSRYARVLEYYVDSAEEARQTNAPLPDELIDLEFVRARHVHFNDIGRNISFNGATLSHSDFWGADLNGSSFINADMQHSNFVFAKLRSTSFRRAQLADASFAGADLSFADFTGADLTRARLGGAQLRCADLRGANLTDADVDIETLLPAYIAPETVLPTVISYEQIRAERARRNLRPNCANVREGVNS